MTKVVHNGPITEIIQYTGWKSGKILLSLRLNNINYKCSLNLLIDVFFVCLFF